MTRPRGGGQACRSSFSDEKEERRTGPQPWLEAMATGTWLGLTQVALGFEVMAGGGGGVMLFFALTAAWLGGGAIGARWLGRQAGPALVGLVLLALGGARTALLLWPLDRAGLVVALLAGAVTGLYGGAYLSGRAARGLPAASLLLYENNGFLLGYAGASLALLGHAPLVDMLVLVLGLGLMLAPRWQVRAPGYQALGLGVVSSALYLAYPHVGDRQWDALMTAAVLARPEAVRAEELLFFAHPLVIPLTAPFLRLAGDPLGAAALREICAGGVVVALGFLGARAVTGAQRASQVAGPSVGQAAGPSVGQAASLVAALVLCLAASRWRLATSGEEKEIALAAGGTFLWLYLDHRDLWRLELGAWRALSPRIRRVLLGLLLALAAAIHLVNGLLFLVVAADAGLAWGARGDLEKGRTRGLRHRGGGALGEAASVLGVAAFVAGPFFLWLAIGPGGARGPREVLGHFFEYHLSGEFVSVPDSLGERLVAAYTGARAWLVGEYSCRWPVLETGLASMAALVLIASARRTGGPVLDRLLVWLALLAAHFFFYEPWDPEAWGSAALAWAVVGAAGLLAPGRGWPLRMVAALGALVLLAVLDGQTIREERAAAAPVRALVDAPRPAAAPLADLSRWIDRRLEPDAILLVSDRLLVPYFEIYTRRRPLVREYLDLTPEELRQRHHLTVLSLRFFTPHMGLGEVAAEAAAGRPVYLLTDGDELLADEIELPWDGLRLGRWSP
jgi:hypothetical protein